MDKKMKKVLMVIGIALLVLLNVFIYTGIVKKCLENNQDRPVLETTESNPPEGTQTAKEPEASKENHEEEEKNAENEKETWTIFTEYEEENYNKGKQGKSTSIANPVVKNLYDKIEVYFIPELYPGFASYNENNFYMDKLVRYESLSEEARLYYAYQTIANIKRRWFQSCDELKGYTYEEKEVYQICLDTDSELIKKDFSSEEWFFNNVNKKSIEDAYHKMYGKDKKMPLKTFTMDFTGVCLYSETIDDFLCFNQTGGDTTPGKGKTKIEKAFEYDDSIEIYDRYVWQEYSMNDKSETVLNYYKSRFHKKEHIATLLEKELKTIDDVLKQGALYKHTFVKDKNGNYYWYSSVRVKE